MRDFMQDFSIDKFLLGCIFIFISIFFGLKSFIIGIILIVAVLFLFFKLKTISKNHFLLISFLIISIFLYVQIRLPKSDLLFQKAPDYVTAYGKIVSIPQQKKDRIKFELETDEVIFEKQKTVINKKQKTLVNIYNAENSKFKLGDRYEIKGKIKQPYEAKNPCEFSYKEYLKQKGIFTLIYANFKNTTRIRGPDDIIYKILQYVGNSRDTIIQRHKNILGSPKAELMGGLVFGDDAIVIPDEIKETFRKSGLLHLLAASGMNVALIFGIWFFIARFFIPVNKATFLGIFIILVYAIMTGLPPSVLRASIMLEMVLIGKLLNKEYKTLNLLALAGIMILLYNPMSFYSISFQLSFIVTFGLVFMFSEIAAKLKSIPGWLSGAILIPVIAQIWVMPLQAYYFNSFNLYSVFANILVVPFIGIISFLSFISSIVALIPFSEIIYTNIDKLLNPLFDVVLFISNFFSFLPNAVLNIFKPSIIQVSMFYTICSLSVFALKENTKNFSFKFAFLISVLIFGLTFLNFNQQKTLSILSFSVGEGDAILINTPLKKTILIDTAKHGFNGYTPAKFIINDYLKDKGIKKLDYIVLTHPDSDHIGGTIDILKEFKVEKLIQTNDKSKSKTYKNIQKYLSENKINVEVIDKKKEIALEKDLTIKIIKPSGVNKNTLNDDSLIVYLKYKDFDALFMADNEKDALETLKTNKIEDIEYLKVGHHASKNSISKEMLEYLKPEVSIVSVGKNNYGHPNKKVIETLNSYSNTFRTDTQNAIKVITNGQKFRVYNWNIKSKSWKKQTDLTQRLDNQAMVLIK